VLDDEISLENLIALNYKQQIMAWLPNEVGKATLYLECFRQFIEYNYKNYKLSKADSEFHYQDYLGLMKYCNSLQGEIK